MPLITLDDVSLDVPDAIARPGLLKGLHEGTYEEDEANAARARVKPGMRVLELGAGLGYVSTICARQAGAENVISVEANPIMVPILKGNLARNGQGAVTVMHGAIVADADPSDEEGMLFHASTSFLGGRLATEDSAPTNLVDVPAVGLRQLLRRHRPNVVMMDVEGAEEYLFDAPWNAHLRFLVMELHPDRYAASVIKRIVDCMSESGLTYDPAVSRGRVLGFRRVWEQD